MEDKKKKKIAAAIASDGILLKSKLVTLKMKWLLGADHVYEHLMVMFMYSALVTLAGVSFSIINATFHARPRWDTAASPLSHLMRYVDRNSLSAFIWSILYKNDV